MNKLTKRQIKTLSEMYRHIGSEFCRAIEWRGKYYWGYYETGSRPIGTVTLDQLCCIGIVEHCFGEYRLKKDEYGDYICKKYLDRSGNFKSELLQD